MTVTTALEIYCTIGGIIGGIMRWGYPYIFTCLKKRSQYEKLNPYATLIFAAIIGYGVSIFFGTDLQNVEGVTPLYVKKLGLLTALFTMSVIDKLDNLAMTQVNKVLERQV